MNDDDFRNSYGRSTAFEALTWALVRTHPDQQALIDAFRENAEILKTHLIGLPISEEYLNGFDKARKELLAKMDVPEGP